jgi:hypothetical protein
VAFFSCNEHDIAIFDETTGEKLLDSETGEVLMRHVFDTLPRVELANFAVNRSYIRNHPEMKAMKGKFIAV